MPESNHRGKFGVRQLRYVIPIILLACLILSMPLFSSVGALPVQEYDMSIPPQYQATYTALQNILNSFNSSLGAYPASTSSLTFATELLPANGNRGPALFQPNNLASVTMNLNALQAMGVQGVTIAIGYPLLDPSFPNSAQYLSYFQQVVSMAHAHGIKVLIESQILFANTPYSPLTYNWAALPYSQYVANHIAQDQLIIEQIHPDYLEIGVEADTEAYLTGYSQLNTPAGWNNYIEQLLSSLNKGNTKLVAGVGTWLSTSFITGFASNPNLDMISTHVYPLYGNNLQNLVQIGKIAQQNNKPLVIDEAWGEKVLQPVTGRGAGTGIGGPLVTQQDVFAYWSPIDIQFLSLMRKFGQIYHVQYLSPFSEDYFFAYLNWTPTLDSMDYFALRSQLEPIVYQNMASNNLSPTGAAYSQLAHSASFPVAEFPNTLLALIAPLFAITATFAFVQMRKTSSHLPSL